MILKSCTAQQVLSDPEKRKIFDQFGEEGLKGGMGGMGGGMPGGMPGGGGGAQFRSMEEMLKEVTLPAQNLLSLQYS